MEAPWTVDVVKAYFDDIGYLYNRAELQHAVICVIKLHREYPRLMIREITEKLYPAEQYGMAIVPSPS